MLSCWFVLCRRLFHSVLPSVLGGVSICLGHSGTDHLFFTHSNHGCLCVFFSSRVTFPPTLTGDQPHCRESRRNTLLLLNIITTQGMMKFTRTHIVRCVWGLSLFHVSLTTGIWSWFVGDVSAIKNLIDLQIYIF